MTDSAVSTLRAELIAAQAILSPQLHGLVLMANDPLSVATLSWINSVLDELQLLSNLIAASLQSLDALDGGGYPDRLPVQIPHDVMAELTQEREDVAAAVAIFKLIPEASNIAISLGEPHPRS